MNHALVIGGTGMLKEAVLRLAGQFDCVSVIARGSFRLNGLWEEGESLGLKINPLQLDYRDDDHLKSTIEDTIKQVSPISMAVSWVKHSARNASKIVAGCLNNQDVQVSYFDLLGSLKYKELNSDEEEREDIFRNLERIDYHQVILGTIEAEEGNRWLTNDEICNGVLKAINSGEHHYTIGSSEESALF